MPRTTPGEGDGAISRGGQALLERGKRRRSEAPQLLHPIDLSWRIRAEAGNSEISLEPTNQDTYADSRQ
jgi:hypothetical protein